MNTERKEKSPSTFRPELTLYHPNGRGTGCAASFAMHPACERKGGCIMVKLANQLTIGCRGETQVFPRFDWRNAIVVKFAFDDLCRILQVFRGECESIDDGRGIYHSTTEMSTKIVLRHMIEPVAGYSLEAYRSNRKSGEESRAYIHLTPAEALGLCESISGAMSVICFGVPVSPVGEMPSVTTTGREGENVSAA